MSQVKSITLYTTPRINSIKKMFMTASAELVRRKLIELQTL